MEQSELGRLKCLLERLLRDSAQPSVKREDIAVAAAADVVDSSQQVTDRDMAIQQIESNFYRTQSIKLALARIADGSYGTCLMCDEDISLKRLRAVPWAAYCVGCQEIADKERKGPESERLRTILYRHVA